MTLGDGWWHMRAGGLAWASVIASARVNPDEDRTMGCDYWIWNDDIYDEQQMVLHRPEHFVDEAELVFDEGRLVPPSSVPEPLTLVPQPGDAGVPSDNVPAPGIRGLLVSAKMRSVLEGEGVDNIQYFPVEIAGHAATPGNYFIANILGRVDCVDTDGSQIDTVDGTIVNIDGLQLQADAAHGLDIFRLVDLPEVVVVSDRLESALARSGCTGVAFIDPSKFAD